LNVNLVQYIKELLYQYECVIIPQLGAFLTQPIPVRINREKGLFFPPGKELSFNSLLTHNDGLLANYIALRKSISYECALKEITAEVLKWKIKLDSGSPLIFNTIGEIALNSEQKIGFSPYYKVNFDTNSIGLTSFSKIPVFKIKAEKPKATELITKKPITMKDSKNEKLAFTPEKKKNNAAYLKYAAVGVIAIALVAISYYFGNQYLTDERLKSTEIAQRKIKANVQKASFDIGEITSLELNVNVENSVIDPDTEIESADFFSVIAGSYRDESNALRMLNKLKGEGFDEAGLAKQSPDGLFRVAFGRFKNKRKAIQLYYFLTQTLEEEAWYLVE